MYSILLEQVESETKSIKQRNQGKFKPDFVDLELLKELNAREYIDFSLSEEYDRLLKLHFHDAVERLDRQQGDTPDKTEHPVLDSQPLASELIADLKSKLQIAEADRDNFYNQKSVFQMQLDIISFVLRIADPIMLKEIYADTKVSYEKQIQEA